MFGEHETAIRALYEILSERFDEFDAGAIDGTKKNGPKPMICITIKDNAGNMKAKFKEPSVPKLYESVLKFLYNDGYLDKLILPIATGSKRYLIATETEAGVRPKHPGGEALYCSFYPLQRHLYGNE